jgi:hypothetical protein
LAEAVRYLALLRKEIARQHLSAEVPHPARWKVGAMVRMGLSVGDIIHSDATKEEGRIVRIVQIEGRFAYIVAIANKISGTEIEALWRPREVKELRDRARRHKATSQNRPVDETSP